MSSFVSSESTTTPVPHVDQCTHQQNLKETNDLKTKLDRHLKWILQYMKNYNSVVMMNKNISSSFIFDESSLYFQHTILEMEYQSLNNIYDAIQKKKNDEVQELIKSWHKLVGTSASSETAVVTDTSCSFCYLDNEIKSWKLKNEQYRNDSSSSPLSSSSSSNLFMSALFCQTNIFDQNMKLFSENMNYIIEKHGSNNEYTLKCYQRLQEKILYYFPSFVYDEHNDEHADGASAESKKPEQEEDEEVWEKINADESDGGVVCGSSKGEVEVEDELATNITIRKKKSSRKNRKK